MTSALFASFSASWHAWVAPLLLVCVCAVLFLIGCGFEKEEGTPKVIRASKTRTPKKRTTITPRLARLKPTTVPRKGKTSKSSSARMLPKLSKDANDSKSNNVEKDRSKSAKLQTKASTSSINTQETSNFVRIEPCKTGDVLEDMVSHIPGPDEEPEA